MNIDAIIVFGYLVLTLILGLYWGRGVKNINDYALGGRNFSTSVLATTIIATYASASGFFVQISRSYDDGIYMLIGFVGQLIGILFFAYYVSTKMGRFAGKLSVAEMMGDLYGKNLRILSSLPIFLVSGGLVAVQIKVLSSTMAYFTNINDLLCIVITALVIIIYSAFGGVRAVTNTDYVQFLTFAIAIPVIFLIVYSSLELPHHEANKQDLIDHLFKLDQQKFPHYAILFIYFVVPSFSPPIIQRMLMAKNTNQIYRSFEIAAITLFAMATLSCMIGGMIHVSNPNLENKEVLGFLIDNYTYPGLKGLLLIGILALAMSTADSNLNAGAVSFSHDFCKPLNLFKTRDELWLARIFSIIIGLIAVILAIYFSDILNLILFIYSFYVPIVSVPIFFAIIGLELPTRNITAGIIFGVVIVLFWSKIQTFFNIDKSIDAFIPGILANFAGVFVSLKIDRLKNRK